MVEKDEFEKAADELEWPCGTCKIQNRCPSACLCKEALEWLKEHEDGR